MALTAIEEAIARLLPRVPVPVAEEVGLDDALGRYLAAQLCAAWDLPGYDDAAMDGVAVRAVDVVTASAASPVALPVVGVVYAGDREAPRVEPGTCVRVATGARLPEGADAVVRQEAVTFDGALARIRVAPEQGEHVRRRGEDFPTGAQVLPRGTRLDPAAIAALAAFGHERVGVARRPRALLVPTGSELTAADGQAPSGPRDSNGPMIAAAIRELGGVARRLAPLPDRAATLRSALERERGDAEWIFTIGGASVGERDFVRTVLAALGAEELWWKVALKPGKAVGAAIWDGVIVVALPGNAAACLAAFDTLARPGLLAQLGASERARRRVSARLAATVTKQPALVYRLRGDVRLDGVGLQVDLPPRQGSGQLTPLLRLPAVVELPQGVGTVEAGTHVDVELLEAPEMAPRPPYVAFVGASDSGKTTLVAELLQAFVSQGLRFAAVKHASEGFHPSPGSKDGDRYEAAGAVHVVVAAPLRRSTVTRGRDADHLASILAGLPGDLDGVLVEGWKQVAGPRVEVHRRGRPRVLADSEVLAVVTDDPALTAAVPVIPRGDAPRILAFVAEALSAGRARTPRGSDAPR